MKRILFVICFLLIWIILYINCGNNKSVVSPDTTISFDIYIASDDISDFSKIKIDQINLLQPAFLSTSDITTYKWDNHNITYPDSIWQRLKTWDNLFHRIFVVSVGYERIYCGRFSDLVDSSAIPGPVIWLLPRHPDGRNTIPESITIDLIQFLISEESGIYIDPRNDIRIYNALTKAGVLIP